MAETGRHEGQDSAKVDENTLCQVVSKTADKINELVHNAKEKIAASGDDFMTTASKYLSPIIGLYASTLAKLNVTSLEEFLNLMKSYHKHEDVRDVYEELIAAEDSWDEILKKYDHALEKRECRTELTVGSPAPLDVQLTDLKTSRTLTLNDLIGKQNLLLVFLRHSA
ncbi:uncharacterized protein [Ptychodera flava]|uniref:uncharacterized protein n=1 Tax=Ptychodera flava TaxID=63121 RepID=UPI00396A53C2